MAPEVDDDRGVCEGGGGGGLGTGGLVLAL